MPTELYEEQFECTVDLLEAILPTPSDIASKDAYPYPRLTKLGTRDRRKFPAFVLENPFLRVVIVPDLGGRIVSIFHKGANLEILPEPSSVKVAVGGRRGIAWTGGIQIVTDMEDRLNGLGHVDAAPSHAPDEGSPAGVWIGEISGNGLSFNAQIALPPDRAEIIVEARVVNRGFDARSYNGGLAIPSSGPLLARAGSAVWNADGRGLGVYSAGLPFEGVRTDPERLFFCRFPEGLGTVLGGRQADFWTVSLVPLAASGRVVAASREAVCSLDGDALKLYSVSRRTGHKVVLLANGQTLEAPADLHPERALEFSLAGMPEIEALVLLDPHRNEVLRYEPQRQDHRSDTGPYPTDAQSVGLHWDRDKLQRATAIPSLRAPAHAALGLQALAAGDFQAGDERLEQALLFNGEDHLTWIAKAMANRLLGDIDEERAELLNAHYLAPLEPLLRAESFLSQEAAMAKEPNPLIRPLAESPEQLVEVACFLLDAGLYDQATRWIDEALRHIDLSMLRYLLGYSYLTKSRMAAEAAQQVEAGSRLPFGPPFPYRAVEVLALEQLAESFPADTKLGQYLSLAKAFATPL